MGGRLLFVSDLHLDAAAPAAVEQFLAFLHDDARHAAGLYILGDLFETWVGDDDDEPVRQRVCAALRALTDAGVPCRLLRGNRDFLLGDAFERATGCSLLPDPVRLEMAGRHIVLSHGDLLCTADRNYQRFRWLMHRPSIRAGFLALPLSTRRAVAAMARAGSRAHARQAPADIMDVDGNAVGALFAASGCDLLIHGHTHRPGVHALHVDGRAATRVVLGDWYEQGSCCVVDGGGFDLQTLARCT